MNKLKTFMQTKILPTGGSSIALLLMRIVAGSAFMIHGWGKMQAPMSWMGPDAPVPGVFQFLAAFSEFVGGLAWIIGLLTPLASLGLMITMLVATAMHMFVMKDPFVNLTGGSAYELPLVYLTIAVVLFKVGPGKYSLDEKLFGNKPSF